MLQSGQSGSGGGLHIFGRHCFSARSDDTDRWFECDFLPTIAAQCVVSGQRDLLTQACWKGILATTLGAWESLAYGRQISSTRRCDYGYRRGYKYGRGTYSGPKVLSCYRFRQLPSLVLSFLHARHTTIRRHPHCWRQTLPLAEVQSRTETSSLLASNASVARKHCSRQVSLVPELADSTTLLSRAP